MKIISSEKYYQEQKAIVSKLPQFVGDGYNWGSGTVVTIGEQSFILGESDLPLALEIAKRWNNFALENKVQDKL